MERGEREAEMRAARARLRAILAEARERSREASPAKRADIVSGPPAMTPLQRNLLAWSAVALLGFAGYAWLQGDLGRSRPPPPAVASEPAAQAAASTLIARPDWVRRPSGEEVGRYYPFFAELFGKDGRAVIRCRVTAQGALDRCVVVGEAPRGWGFGKAALKMSALFRMGSATRDGRSVEGAQVTIPIRFILG